VSPPLPRLDVQQSQIAGYPSYTAVFVAASPDRSCSPAGSPEVKRDQRNRGRNLGGTIRSAGGWARMANLVPTPEQQKAIKTMKRLRAKGCRCGRLRTN
jgi:hypothetical protein